VNRIESNLKPSETQSRGVSSPPCRTHHAFCIAGCVVTRAHKFYHTVQALLRKVVSTAPKRLESGSPRSFPAGPKAPLFIPPHYLWLAGSEYKSLSGGDFASVSSHPQEGQQSAEQVIHLFLTSISNPIAALFPAFIFYKRSNSLYST